MGEDVTEILKRAGDGDAHAQDEVFRLVYDELKRMAQDQLHNERPNHTLRATELVHEAYIRLVQGERATWNDRSHFFALAARVIRQILVDHARHKVRKKRGGDLGRLSLTAAEGIAPDHESIDILELDDALEKLGRLKPIHADLVVLRFFGGMTSAQAAATLGVSPRTADDHWAMAKAFLKRELSDDGCNGHTA